ncbi:hypothetical protein ACFL09_01155, partial [Planctomycetota bacterium]
MSDAPGARRAPDRRAWLAGCAALVAFGVWLWWGRAADLDLHYAAHGFGPMAYTYKRHHPDQFRRDFPGGAENFDKSAPMHAYPLAYRYLGVPPERLVPVILALELALIAAAAIALTRTLRPEAPPIVPILVALLVLASQARNINFGAYGQPYHWAKYHNFADAFRLFAVVMILRGRPIAAGILAAVSLMCHPTMGLMGAAFVAACALWRPRESLGRWHLAGAAAFLVLAGAWGLIMVGTGQSQGEPFPRELWFSLTRLSSYHWYPIHKGLLTYAHRAALLPFLSLLALTAFYLTRSGSPGERERRVLCGIGATLAITVVGLIFSVVDVSPLMTKLCLARSNEMVISVALVYVVAGLWGDIATGPPWRQLAAAVVLAAPFFSNPGFPLVFIVLLTLPAWLPACQGRFTSRWDLLPLVPAAASVLLVIVYAATDLAGPVTSAAYTGFGWLGKTPVLVGLAAVAVAAAVPHLRERGIVRIVVLVAIACSAAHWTLESRLKPRGKVWCRNYKAAQLWARENTPKDALFLIDPVIRHPGLGYGWRDYAQRSSFGMLREWLLTGWNYNSDIATCRDALERLRAFGFDVHDYLDTPHPLDDFE